MTKKDIVLKIADKTGIKQVVIKNIVQGALDAIVDALSEGERVELRNFGIFKVKERKSKMGRNPRTGSPVPIPIRKVVVFKPGLKMKGDVK